MKRAEFISKCAILGVSGISGMSVLSGCGRDETISPVEDLMREHGVLSRVMLIYDTCRERLESGDQNIRQSILAAAGIVRNFIENYHEKLEEDHVFPAFMKTDQMAALVQMLAIQHKQGRGITERIMLLAKDPSSAVNNELAKELMAFNRMYRPHAAREDTVLFPGLKNLVSSGDYSSMGEIFEQKEQELFGKEGFHSIVQKVENLEKQLNINDLSQFSQGA